MTDHDLWTAVYLAALGSITPTIKPRYAAQAAANVADAALAEWRERAPQLKAGAPPET